MCSRRIASASGEASLTSSTRAIGGEYGLRSTSLLAHWILPPSHLRRHRDFGASAAYRRAMNRPRTSRQHYDVFRHDYRDGTLDDKLAGLAQQPARPERGTKRREYLHDYLRWL